MKIEIYKAFEKERKRLHKRYKNINKDILELIQELKNNPQLGTDLGNGIRKVRMSIRDKNKGKSGGARVITLLTQQNEEEDFLGLHYIYDKSEHENILFQKICDIISHNLDS